MTTVKKFSSDSLKIQEHCIDLPGESVQCWLGGGTDKLKIILRKHRDIIFDIHLGNGMTYTLESTESDFYNPRDKKLVYAARHSKVSFKDGERLHVWVSRFFQGALVLKSDERIIYKVEPNKWDEQSHSDDPKEKPAPIIVAIGSETVKPKSTKDTPEQTIKSPPLKPAKLTPHILPIKATPVHSNDLSCPVICVVEGDAATMPAYILEHFKKGGDHSGFADIDPNHVTTRNWIWGQAAGAGAYIKDNWDWLRASLDGKTNQGFKLVKAKVHYVRGKVRFYFSGYSNSNTVYGRGGFGPSHDRIMSIFGGAGKTTSAFAASMKGIAGSFKGAALVSFIFGTATAIAEWKDDVHKDGYDLAATLITTTIKAVLAAALTTIIIAIVLWIIMISFGAAIPIIAIGAITLGVGYFVNYAIEGADKYIAKKLTHDQLNTDGSSSIVASWMRETKQSIQERMYQNWRYLMHRMVNDYQELIF